MTQRHAEFVRALHHIGVLQGAGGRNDRTDARGGGDFEGVREREEPGDCLLRKPGGSTALQRIFP